MFSDLFFLCRPGAIGTIVILPQSRVTCHSQVKEMKQILIVDDFEPGRLVLRERLEMQGYLCQEVEDGSEALRAMQTQHFDLVITDNQMPVMTGLQLLQCLAERPEDQRTPVIFTTGQLSEHLSNAAQTAGACAVLQKPYNDEELISEIARILKPQEWPSHIHGVRA